MKIKIVLYNSIQAELDRQFINVDDYADLTSNVADAIKAWVIAVGDTIKIVVAN